MQKNENRPGYKKTKVGWIPVGWKEASLGEFTKWGSGGTPSKANETYWNGDIPWISAISMRGTRYNDSVLRITESGLKAGSRLAPKNSLLLLVRGSMLFKKIPVGIVERDVSFNQDVKSIIPDEQISSPDYLLCWLTGHENRLLGMVGGTGIGAGKLDLGELQSMELALPSLPEQEAIAGVLECWDKGIRKLEKKIGKKRNIKKGLMQRLLSGRLRLPGFSEDWKKVRLGKVLSEKPQYGINAASVPFSDDLPAYLRITDISEDGRFLKDGKTSVDHPDTESYVLSCGDLVFARTGASTGKAFLYSSNHGKLVFAGFLIRISTDRNKLEPSFLKFYTETHEYWNWVNVMSTRSGQPGINGQEYAQLIIPLPPLEEQQAIAEVLSAADGEIEVLERKLEKWWDQKKYLLNNLVTGTLRLPQFRN